MADGFVPKMAPWLALILLVLGASCAPGPASSPSSAPPPAVSNDKVIGKNPDGRTLYQGERGGRYYFSDSGNKVYIDTPDDKMVGKTKDGRFLYQGPRGGLYYYNDRGEKTYIQVNY